MSSWAPNLKPQRVSSPHNHASTLRIDFRPSTRNMVLPTRSHLFVGREKALLSYYMSDLQHRQGIAVTVADPEPTQAVLCKERTHRDTRLRINRNLSPSSGSLQHIPKTQSLLQTTSHHHCLISVPSEEGPNSTSGNWVPRAAGSNICSSSSFGPGAARAPDFGNSPPTNPAQALGAPFACCKNKGGQ